MAKALRRDFNEIDDVDPAVLEIFDEYGTLTSALHGDPRVGDLIRTNGISVIDLTKLDQDSFADTYQPYDQIVA